jgi:hypothetical protein
MGTHGQVDARSGVRRAQVSASRPGPARQRPQLPAGIVHRRAERMFLPRSSAVTLTIEVDVAGAGPGFPSLWPPGLGLPPEASWVLG